MEKFEKLRLSLRYYLQGAADQNKAFLVVLEAFEFAMGYHTGLRKDGATPEFMHQIETVLYMRTLLSGLMYPAETLAAMLLHDVAEDYDVPVELIREKFGERIAHAVWRLTKKFRGQKKPAQQYFAEMLDCPIAPLCKGADRINNQQSMQGVFTREKQLAYIQETEEHILPMLKQARRRYPSHENALMNIYFVLKAQIEFIRRMQLEEAV